MRRELLERYISTGKVGMVKPSSDSEALDLIETVIEIYDPTPVKMTLSEMSDELKKMLDF